MHDDLELMFYRRYEFLIRKNSCQQDNRFADTGRAQFKRFGQPRDSERIDVTNIFSHRNHAMSIGIGFDYGHDFRVWRSVSDNAEIMFECTEPYERPCSEGHG
jgi:hypothetical protein